MKRLSVWLAVLLLLPLCAWAEGTITACGITVDAEATAIDFGGTIVRDIKALEAMLDRMPQLTQVDMYASSLSKQEMDELFTRYPQITFGWTYYVGDHKVRTDITAFSTLHGSSPDPIHSERDFQWLKFCKGLKAIDLGHNWIADVSFLTSFPELKVLILGVNRVSDLTPLGQLQELEYLELFTNWFTDITPLTQMTRLRDLNLKNTPVADLSPLFGMKSLERLWVGGPRMANLPGGQREQLSAALPDCEIDWDSNPTAGTWRTHPRYDVIYRIFHTQVYEPFDP